MTTHHTENTYNEAIELLEVMSFSEAKYKKALKEVNDHFTSYYNQCVKTMKDTVYQANYDGLLITSFWDCEKIVHNANIKCPIKVDERRIDFYKQLLHNYVNMQQDLWIAESNSLFDGYNHLNVFQYRKLIENEELSKVEGLSFGIISNRLSDHLVYSYQNERKIQKGISEAKLIADKKAELYSNMLNKRRDDIDTDLCRLKYAPRILKKCHEILFDEMKSYADTVLKYIHSFEIADLEKTEKLFKLNNRIITNTKKLDSISNKFESINEKLNSTKQSLDNNCAIYSTYEIEITKLQKKIWGKKKAYQKIAELEIQKSAIKSTIESLELKHCELSEEFNKILSKKVSIKNRLDKYHKDAISNDKHFQDLAYKKIRSERVIIG